MRLYLRAAIRRPADRPAPDPGSGHYAPHVELTRDPAPLCALHVGQREGLAVVGGLVSEAADALGLPASERANLRALAQQVLDVIVADSFADGASIDLDVQIERRPGGMAVVMADRGAPSSLALGTYPPQIADLIRLGFADDLSVHNEGRQGNRTEILKSLRYPVVAEDEAFGAAATAEASLELGPDGTPALDVRPLAEGDGFELARLFYRTYGYSAYYAPVVYEPERLAEYVRAGRHIGTVAVTPSGRIVGHVATKVERPGDITGSVGLLAIEPAYRSFGITARIGLAHVVRLIEMGFVGQFTEAVTVHDRSQKAALKSGGHEVGLMLAGQQSSLEFEGFDVEAGRRHAVMLMYGNLTDTPERTVFVPPAYSDIASTIYSTGSLARILERRPPRPPEDGPERTRFAVQLKQEGNAALLRVEEYGRDFDAALQSQLAQFRLNRYDLILLMLPLGDPLTAFYGNGLQSLGLSFAGIYPEYSDGDVLVLQSLNNVEVDAEDILTASDHGAHLKEFVLEDLRRAADFSARQQRSQARMARVYDALD